MIMAPFAIMASLYGNDVARTLSPSMTYVAVIVSLGASCVVKRQVPAAQICVQCAMTESDPSGVTVPVHVPATSASVNAGGVVASAAESAGGVSALAHASRNGTARMSLRIVAPVVRQFTRRYSIMWNER